MPLTAKIRRIWKALPGQRPSRWIGGELEVVTRMSIVLYVVGAIVTMLGVGMVGYGIPINEFSFGNTLIIAGTTATVGGLVLIAIGTAVGQLRRIGQAVAMRTPVRASESLEAFEPPAESQAAPVLAQSQLPRRPKAEPRVREPQLPLEAEVSADMPVEDRTAAAAAPTLPNPVMPAGTVEEFEFADYEDVSLSPRQPVPASEPADLDEPAPSPPVTFKASPAIENRAKPPFDAPWRFAPPPPQRQSEAGHFDAMWPAEPRQQAKRIVADEPQPELPRSVMTPAPETPNLHPTRQPPVAILKSGVVDGMGYTIYVDGSIEAELPQGTLRFASINDLREHLTRNA